MLSSAKEIAYITPKAFPQKHSKCPLSKDIIISKDSKQKTRNISSSLKVSITETTANASDSIKHKKGHTIQFVHPFSYLDPPKVPPSTRNIPPKCSINNNPLTPRTSCLNPKNTNDNKENETINVNELFKMKNYQSNLLKYSMVKSKLTRQKDTKPKMNRIIYVEMNHNFVDRKISVRPSKDKTLEKESKDAKIKMRFWKGVFDSSYPKILIKKINCWKKYSNISNQFINANKLNKDIDNEMKIKHTKEIEQCNRDINDNKALGKKKIKIGSFNQSRENLSNDNNSGFNRNCSKVKQKKGLGHSMSIFPNGKSLINEHGYYHKRSQAVLICNNIL